LLRFPCVPPDLIQHDERFLNGQGFIAFSPDGKLLASGGGVKDKRPLGLWEVATGQQVGELVGQGNNVLAGAFSNDGHLLATADGNVVRVWAVAGRAIVQTLTGSRDPIRAVAFTPDGKAVVTAGGEGTTCLWDVGTGQLVRCYDGLSGGVRAVAVAPDGQAVAAGGNGGVRLWTLAGGPVWQLPAGSGGELVFSPDGKTLAVGGTRAQFLDAATGRETGPVGQDLGLITDLAFSPDGRTLATVGRVARLWDVATGKQTHLLDTGNRQPYHVLFLRDGTLVAKGLDFVSAWGPPFRTERFLLSRERGEWCQGRFAITPDGKKLAIASVEVTLWDLAEHREERRFGRERQGTPLFPGEQAKEVPCVAFSSDGKLLASGSRHDVRLWDPGTGELLRTFEGHEADVNAVLFEPGGGLLASLAEVDVRVHELRSGLELARLVGVEVMAFSPDGRFLATEKDDLAVVVYDLASGKECRHFAGHRAGVTCLAFAPDGATLASGSDDGTVLLWDVNDLCGPGRPAPAARGDREWQALWDDLKVADPADAYRAVWALAESPGPTADFLKRRLRPAAVDEPHVARLVAELDSESSAVRRQALRELEDLDDLAVPALRRALAGQPSVEVRRRVTDLLEVIEPGPSPECLRRLRAVEALQRAAGPDERKLLEELAGGAEGARTTREARAALRRLGGE
jgi:WD40 repeat protein